MLSEIYLTKDIQFLFDEKQLESRLQEAKDENVLRCTFYVLCTKYSPESPIKYLTVSLNRTKYLTLIYKKRLYEGDNVITYQSQFSFLTR